MLSVHHMLHVIHAHICTDLYSLNGGEGNLVSDFNETASLSPVRRQQQEDCLSIMYTNSYAHVQSCNTRKPIVKGV